MKSLSKLFACILSLVLVCSFTSCLDDVSCTNEFVIVGVEVQGGDLEDFYTIRSSTGDTLKFEEAFANFYTILDDTYQKTLENEEEAFVFVGMLSDSIVIEEPYIIGANSCHIFKVSGPALIDL